MAQSRPDLVFHATVSRFKDAFGQPKTSMARLGINVVSSCEELLYPRLREPRCWPRLSRLTGRTLEDNGESTTDAARRLNQDDALAVEHA